MNEKRDFHFFDYLWTYVCKHPQKKMLKNLV